ncbi:MAG: MFS transporter [Promethearchaeota archaeon]
MSEEKYKNKFELFVIVLAAIIAWMHDGYSLVIISLLANDLKTFFGVGDAAIGLTISLQFVATVPGAILFGELGDRFGRKKALLISIAWDAVFSAATALVPAGKFFLFFLLRFISGLGVSWGISFSLISEYFQPKRRGAAGGLVHSTFVVGYVSAIIVTLLLSPYGWQYCFLTALFPFPFLVLFWFALPESAVWAEFDQLTKEGKIKQKLRIKELFSGRWLKITVLLIILFWLCESAYHMLVDLAPVFFEYLFAYLGAANPGNSALFFMLGLMVVAAFVLFGFGALSDYIGRKKAFYLDNIFGVVGGSLFGIFLLLSFNSTMILVGSFLITASFGLHGIFGVWSSELYDTELRASANSIIFSVARGAGFGGFIVGMISDALNPYGTTAERLANPFISLQALGTGMLLCLAAYIGIMVVLTFVPEPLDKTITALPKTSKVMKP